MTWRRAVTAFVLLRIFVLVQEKMGGTHLPASLTRLWAEFKINNFSHLILFIWNLIKASL